MVSLNSRERTGVADFAGDTGAYVELTGGVGATVGADGGGTDAVAVVVWPATFRHNVAGLTMELSQCLITVWNW